MHPIGINLHGARVYRMLENHSGFVVTEQMGYLF